MGYQGDHDPPAVFRTVDCDIHAPRATVTDGLCPYPIACHVICPDGYDRGDAFVRALDVDKFQADFGV